MRFLWYFGVYEVDKNRILEFIPFSAGLALTSSCFVILGELLKNSRNGLNLLLAVVVGAGICFVIARSVSYLMGMYPSNAGIRAWIQPVLGEWWGLFSSYTMLSIIFLFSGAEMLVLAEIIHKLYSDMPILISPVLMIISILIINLLSLSLSKKVQQLSVIMMLMGLISLSIIGLVGKYPTHNVDFYNVGDWRLIPLMIGSTIFLFVGFEWVCSQGETRHDFESNIPISMNYSIALLCVVYSSLLIISSLVLPENGGSGFLHLDLARHLLGERGIIVALVFSMLALFTTFNSSLMGVSRLIYGMSREGKMPKYLSYLSNEKSIPYASLIFVCSVSLIFAIVEYLTSILIAALIVCSSLYCFIYALVIFTKITIQSKQGSAGVVLIEIITLLVLFVIGIASLVSVPGQTSSALFLFVIIIIVSFILTINYSTNMKNLIISGKGKGI